MRSAAMAEIEQRLNELSLNEQLRLLERLASQVRRRVSGDSIDMGSDLPAMAADPDIQRELRMHEGI